jgi:hypothetical protein
VAARLVSVSSSRVPADASVVDTSKSVSRLPPSGSETTAENLGLLVLTNRLLPQPALPLIWALAGVFGGRLKVTVRMG